MGEARSPKRGKNSGQDMISDLKSDVCSVRSQIGRLQTSDFKKIDNPCRQHVWILPAAIQIALISFFERVNRHTAALATQIRLTLRVF